MKKCLIFIIFLLPGFLIFRPILLSRMTSILGKMLDIFNKDVLQYPLMSLERPCLGIGSVTCHCAYHNVMISHTSVIVCMLQRLEERKQSRINR